MNKQYVEEFLKQDHTIAEVMQFIGNIKNDMEFYEIHLIAKKIKEEREGC